MHLMRYPLHPILLGILPVLYFFVQNSQELEWFDIIRPLAVSFVGSLICYLIVFWVSKNKNVSMMASSLVIIMLTMFSSAYENLFVIFPALRYRYYAIFWVITFGMSAFYIIKNGSKLKQLSKINEYINLFALLMIGMQVWKMAGMYSYISQSAQIQSESQKVSSTWLDQIKNSGKSLEKRPDIYYLVLDAYAREDILRSRYDYDNRPFLDHLKALNFSVSDQSTSNYPFTHLSLSSTLNLDELQNFLPTDLMRGAPSTNPERYHYLSSKLGKEYISKNRLRYFLESLGYEWHRNDSGYPMTRLRNESLSDIFTNHISQLEMMILESNMIGHFLGQLSQKYSVQAFFHHKWRNGLEQFASMEDHKSPKFIFYHIVSPHAPFCFDENGGIAKELVEGLVAPGVNDERLATASQNRKYRELYPKNLAGLNIYVLETITKILEKSNGEAIIIIQSDHGPSLGFNYYKIDESDLKSRFANLNAVYMPPNYERSQLDGNISNVNTFRVLLSSIFGVDLPKIKDRAWFAFAGNLEFSEVTNQVQLLEPKPVDLSTK
ncbi:MAG: hypothetical protein DWI24_05105 [Planctomycetota bacterium]|nr:MAG: hypothetical protein DWI24_05105 [Planctomycetota bacterium]